MPAPVSGVNVSRCPLALSRVNVEAYSNIKLQVIIIDMSLITCFVHIQVKIERYYICIFFSIFLDIFLYNQGFGFCYFSTDYIGFLATCSIPSKKHNYNIIFTHFLLFHNVEKIFEWVILYCSCRNSFANTNTFILLTRIILRIENPLRRTSEHIIFIYFLSRITVSFLWSKR